MSKLAKGSSSIGGFYFSETIFFTSGMYLASNCFYVHFIYSEEVKCLLRTARTLYILYFDVIFKSALARTTRL